MEGMDVGENMLVQLVFSSVRLVSAASAYSVRPGVCAQKLKFTRLKTPAPQAQYLKP